MIPLSSCLNIEKLIESRTREDSSFQARATQKCSPRELRTLTGVCSRQLLGVGCSGTAAGDIGPVNSTPANQK